MTGKPSGDIAELLEIMRRLRSPKGGCPWDLEQDFDTIAPYTVEEAYEVADAIARKDMAALKDELGDLLFQSVYHAQMASEAGHFDFAEVVRAICAKMIHRHPHVFGELVVKTSNDQTSRWEELKAVERAARKAAQGKAASVLDDLPPGLPELKQAEKFQKRAARVGFDWPKAMQVLDKIEEEIGEIKAAMAEGASREKLADEIGDLLFGAVNLYFLLQVTGRDLSGMHLPYRFPVSLAVMLLPVILGAALFSALWPAEAAVRTSLVEALEYE